MILQPRTIASTVEIVRAVVTVEASTDVKVGVTLREEDDVGREQARRRKLTEEIFFEEIAENTSVETAAKVEDLIEALRSVGVMPSWGSASVSMRFPDPKLSGRRFTVVVITTSGTFYLGWLERLAELGGYDDGITLRYIDDVVKLMGLPRDYEYSTVPARVESLLQNAEQFISIVRRFVHEIQTAVPEVD